MVVAQCFQRRGVNCKRTGAGPPPPHPARLPMKCIGTAVHPLPQGGEGKSRKARKSQQKCRNYSDRPKGRPYRQTGTPPPLRVGGNLGRFSRRTVTNKTSLPLEESPAHIQKKVDPESGLALISR